MNEQEINYEHTNLRSYPILVNIDDLYTLPLSVPEGKKYDFTGFDDFLEEFRMTALRSKIIFPAEPIVIILDEHVETSRGRYIYQALGQFILGISSNPEMVFILGNSSLQSYIPENNRTDKSIYATLYSLNRFSKVFVKMQSVKELFDNSGFVTPFGLLEYESSEVPKLLAQLSVNPNTHLATQD